MFVAFEWGRKLMHDHYFIDSYIVHYAYITNVYIYMIAISVYSFIEMNEMN